MKRHMFFFAAALCCVIASQASTEAVAQESSMRGTWILNRAASTLAQWPDVWPDVKAGIRKQAEALGFVFQKIEFNKAKIVSSNLVGGGTTALRMPADTDRMRWTFRQQTLSVSTAWEDGLLTRTFRAEDGQRVENYSLSADGKTLTVNVGISMPTIQKSVNYVLVYNEN